MEKYKSHVPSHQPVWFPMYLYDFPYVGMMTFPIYVKIKHVPSHQAVQLADSKGSIPTATLGSKVVPHSQVGET